MKPVNKLQLFSRSTKMAVYFLYFAIAGLIIVFIISYFIKGSDSAITDSNNPDDVTITGQRTPSPIPALPQSEVKSYPISDYAVGVVAQNDYVQDPNTPKDQAVVSLIKPSTNQRIIVRIIQTNPNTTAEIYARENLKLYGDEVQDARSFKKSIFGGFRYVVLSTNKSLLFSVAFIKTQDQVHTLQVSGPVTDGKIDSMKSKNEADLDQLLSTYNLSSYEERELLNENGYTGQ